MDFNEERKSVQYPRRSIQIDRKSLLMNPRKSIADAKKAAALFALASESSATLRRATLSSDEMPKRLSTIGMPKIPTSVNLPKSISKSVLAGGASSNNLKKSRSVIIDENTFRIEEAENENESDIDQSEEPVVKRGKNLTFE